MKKFLATLLAVCMIVSSVVVFSTTTVAAEDAGNTIYVSAEGNDENAGTESAPVATINKAIALVANNGTVHILDTVKVHTGTTEAGTKDIGNKSGKNITITGGVLDATNILHVRLWENITFDNVTLSFTDGKYLFASGYKLTINENVIVNGKISLYGGAYGASCGSTEINIFAGTYNIIHGASHNNNYDVNGDTRVIVGGTASANNIYGAGSNSDVSGSTYVWVGGNVNSACDETSHSSTYNVYGGGSNSIIGGSTTVIFTGNAKANYIYGGGQGSNSSIAQGSNITMSGNAKTMSMYGGSNGATQNSDANVTLAGGTLEQILGGCYAANLTGNVTVRLLGGNVTRRVYGGCYNDYATDILGGKFGWQSHHNVEGIIYLVIGSGVTFQLSGSDTACSAHSRRNTVNTDQETGVVIYANDTVKSNTKLNSGFAGGATHETAHVYKYTLNGNVITQTCSEHGDHSATATITPTGNTYNGSAIVVDVEYSENWEYEKFDVSYANNVNAGTATATLTISDFTTQTYNYSITKLSQKEPSVRANGNKIAGLTTDMEYSTDGKTYTKVSDANMTFENGKYLVRYAESTNASLSRATMVYIYTGAYCVSANKANAVQGGTVDVFVQIPVNSGLDNINITVGYDELALTLEGFTAGKFEGATLEGNVISWSGDNTAKTGTLAKLTFAVKEDAELGDYEITLSAEGFSVVNGGISVSEFVHGDVNGDGGKINVSDIISLRGAVVDESTGELANGADVNGDGIVNCQDIILIRQYLANYNYTTGESSVVLGAAQ